MECKLKIILADRMIKQSALAKKSWHNGSNIKYDS